MRIYVVPATASVLLAGAGTAARFAASASALRHFDDGSFETPTVPANTFQTFTAGKSIGPWQVTSGTVDLIGVGYR